MDTLNIIKEIIKNDKITLDSKIKRIGLDSLEFVEKLLEIEDYFVIEISDDDLESFSTIRDLVECIDKLK